MRNLNDKKRIVIKVGTSTLTFSNGKLNLSRIDKLARVLTSLKNSGKEIILVTSGAIAAGRDKLSLGNGKLDTALKQATSSIGQCALMGIYSKFFGEYNQCVSQILLTKIVLENEESLINAKNTFNTLLELGIIPIVNENDTISTNELGFSDNDNLSSLVSVITNSDLLIILSDIDGLFNEDPHKNPNAKLINEVTNINDEIKKSSTESISGVGTGGMNTKICACEYCLKNNIECIIANGNDPYILEKIIDGEELGTYFRKI